jgi:hypothetical protein
LSLAVAAVEPTMEEAEEREAIVLLLIANPQEVEVL